MYRSIGGYKSKNWQNCHSEKGGAGVKFESGECLKMSLKLEGGVPLPVRNLEEGDFDVSELETYVPGGRHLGT